MSAGKNGCQLEGLVRRDGCLTRKDCCRKRNLPSRNESHRSKDGRRARQEVESQYEETTACQDAMETNPREKVDVVERQKIPNELHSNRECRNERTACQETEGHLEEKEPTSVEMKIEVAKQGEVPVENSVLKPVQG
jgi:hypothetical protein